jgi:hypothetical protein
MKAYDYSSQIFNSPNPGKNPSAHQLLNTSTNRSIFTQWNTNGGRKTAGICASMDEFQSITKETTHTQDYTEVHPTYMIFFKKTKL